MRIEDLAGIGLYFAYFVAAVPPLMLFKARARLPFEITRKLYHLVITLSIFPLVTVFRTWYASVLAVVLFALIVYPILTRLESFGFYRQVAVERAGGEFKSSLIIVQASMALLLFIFWGLLGSDWKFIAAVAVMAWGFGDAAAALVGKAFGKRRIHLARVNGTKTCEGTLAMYVTAGLAVFFTLLLYAGQPWLVSLAIALLVAPVSAAVELFTNRGLDTLTVPISTGLAVLSWLQMFAYLGA
jgi:phytol kinase